LREPEKRRRYLLTTVSASNPSAVTICSQHGGFRTVPFESRIQRLIKKSASPAFRAFFGFILLSALFFINFVKVLESEPYQPLSDSPFGDQRRAFEAPAVIIPLIKNLCLGKGGGEGHAAFTRSRDIDKLLREDEKKMARQVKVLLLGQSKFMTNPKHTLHDSM
jgi:hypothetical protein